jgi:hypothetical protein
MEKEIIVKQCYHSCHFYGRDSEVMCCNHPYWDDKKYEERFIISHNPNNCTGTVPDLCPLRIDHISLIYRLENINM